MRIINKKQHKSTEVTDKIKIEKTPKMRTMNNNDKKHKSTKVTAKKKKK